MKVKVKWKELKSLFYINGLVPKSYHSDDSVFELEAEPVEEKKPLTNLEKWFQVNNVFFETLSTLRNNMTPAIAYCEWLDSKGVSADEAYRILIEEKK